MRRALLALAATVLLVASLSGCGKRGDPHPPDDEPQTYPRVYPTAP